MPDLIFDTGTPGTLPPPPPDGTPPPASSGDSSSSGNGSGSGDAGTPAPPRRHHTQPKKTTQQNLAAWKPEDRPAPYKPARKADPTRHLAEIAHQHGMIAAVPGEQNGDAGARHHSRQLYEAGAESEKHSQLRQSDAAGPGPHSSRLRLPASEWPAPPVGAKLQKMPRHAGRLAITTSGQSPPISGGVHEVTPFLDVKLTYRASATLSWSGGRGKTLVSLDPRTHEIAVEHGPLSVSDQGNLYRLGHPREVAAAYDEATSGHRTLRTRDPFKFDFAIGSRNVHLPGLHDVRVSTRIRTEALQKSVVITVSKDITKKVSGYGKVNLDLRLTADLTPEPRLRDVDLPAEEVILAEFLLIAAVTGLVITRPPRG